MSEPDRRMRIGIDLGGTKIEVIALDDDGRERFRKRIASPRGNYAATIEAVAGLVRDAEETAGPGTVGIGMPGTISPATGLVKNANSTWLNGQRLAGDLERRLGRPLRLANDANCLALSEASDGAAAGSAVVFAVILGTGTGGGVVVHRDVLVGANAIAGEWGHNPMPWPTAEEWPGPPCYCGRTGCIETLLSGPGLAADHKRYTGRDMDAAEIVAEATNGMPGGADAAATLERYESRLARALASIINVLDPDVIVAGGGLSNIERLYRTVPRLWTPYVFSDRVDTRFVRAMHGDSSGVRGAARLWENAVAL